MIGNKEKKNRLQEIKKLLEYEKEVRILLNADRESSRVNKTKFGEAIGKFFLEKDISIFPVDNKVRKEICNLVKKHEGIDNLDKYMKETYELYLSKILEYPLSKMRPQKSEEINHDDMVVNLNLFNSFKSFYQFYQKREKLKDACKVVGLELAYSILNMETIIFDMKFDDELKAISKLIKTK